MNKTLMVCVPMMVILTAVVSIVPVDSHAAEKLTLKVYASKIAANDLNNLCVSYEKQRPDLAITVSGGRITDHFKAMFAAPKHCLAVSSRPMTDEERKEAADKGLQLQERVIAKRPVGIVVNANVQVGLLALQQVRDIFTGNYTNWNQLGGQDEAIKLFARPDPQDGIAVWFREEVLEGRPVTENAKILTFDSELLKAVSRSPGAIGYSALKKDMPERVKFIAIKESTEDHGVAPSRQTARDGTYPLTMSLFAYWDKSPDNREIESLVKFIEGAGL